MSGLWPGGAGGQRKAEGSQDSDGPELMHLLGLLYNSLGLMNSQSKGARKKGLRVVGVSIER